MTYTSVYLGGNYCMRVTFPDQASCEQWDHDMRVIKYHIDEINEDDNAGRAREYRQWLANVRRIIGKWTENNLAPDIKESVNDVERNLGIQETAWVNPPQRYLV